MVNERANFISAHYSAVMERLLNNGIQLDIPVAVLMVEEFRLALWWWQRQAGDCIRWYLSYYSPLYQAHAHPYMYMCIPIHSFLIIKEALVD